MVPGERFVAPDELGNRFGGWRGPGWAGNRELSPDLHLEARRPARANREDRQQRTARDLGEAESSKRDGDPLSQEGRLGVAPERHVREKDAYPVLREITPQALQAPRPVPHVTTYGDVYAARGLPPDSDHTHSEILQDQPDERRKSEVAGDEDDAASLAEGGLEMVPTVDPDGRQAPPALGGGVGDASAGDIRRTTGMAICRAARSQPGRSLMRSTEYPGAARAHQAVGYWINLLRHTSCLALFMSASRAA